MGIILGLFETILYVEDMAAQVAFYRDKLGLAVKEPRGLADYSHEYWVELDTGPCTLVLHGGGKRRLSEDAPKVVFQVENISEARAALLARGVSLGQQRTPAPGVWVCDGYDPEGNKFSIESR